MSNVTPESTEKLYCFWSDHTSFSTILYDFAHNPTPKQTANKAETAWPSWPTRSIFEPHFIPRPCRTSRLNPVKNHKVVVRYCWLWQACGSCRKKPFKTGKQHGLAGFFEPHFIPRRCQTSRLNASKKIIVIVFWYDNLMLVVAGFWKLYRHGRPLRPLPQRFKTGKQHGVAGPTDPFLRHISPSPDVKRHA